MRLQPINGGAMLYDVSRAGNANAHWLDAAWWARRGTVTPAAAGRGSTNFIDADGRSLVLRHYRRGGLAARISVDHYWWRSGDETRAFIEWHLLYLMRRQGLPVPEPIAARYLRRGRSYSADLLMQQILDTRSLAACLQQQPLSIALWVAVGRCLRRFHRLGVCHADLNAHNILFDAADQVWVIDFDRASLRGPGLWSDANLARLYRSLQKLSSAWPEDRFTTDDWSSLLSGYFAEAAALESAA